mmetsp:Transcript_33585/g.100109  ORF Transcript_33585/g.100109 Transcript_33585/m.100109 type:complete len:247 (+) Transcript_33585:153-893(+)
MPPSEEASSSSSSEGADDDDYGDLNGEIDLPPPLWSPSSHFRVTRRGKILKSVSERYLRDDLGLGFHISTSNGGAGGEGGGGGSNIQKRRGGGEGKVVEVQSAGPARRIGAGEELLACLVRPPPIIVAAGNRRGGGGGSVVDSREKKIRLAVCDANVLLGNLDVLEHPSRAMPNLAIPQTALAECRHRSVSSYGRAVELLRSSSHKRCAIFFPDGHHVEARTGIDGGGGGGGGPSSSRVQPVPLPL